MLPLVEVHDCLFVWVFFVFTDAVHVDGFQDTCRHVVLARECTSHDCMRSAKLFVTQHKRTEVPHDDAIAVAPCLVLLPLK